MLPTFYPSLYTNTSFSCSFRVDEPKCDLRSAFPTLQNCSILRSTILTWMHPDALSSAYVEQCSCRRTFLSPAALKNHQNSCLSSKKHLSTVLAKAQRHLSADASARKKRILAIGREPSPSLPVETDAPHVQPDIDCDDVVSADTSWILNNTKCVDPLRVTVLTRTLKLNDLYKGCQWKARPPNVANFCQHASIPPVASRCTINAWAIFFRRTPHGPRLW